MQAKTTTFLFLACFALLLAPLSGCGCSSSDDGAGVLPSVPTRLFATTTDSANARAEAVVELDPATGAELNRFALPEVTPSGYGFDGLAFDGTHLWFITGDNTGTLYQLDPDTGAVLDSDPITPPAGAISTFDGLAALGGLVYISDGNGFILVFDPASDTVVNSFDVATLNASVTTISGGVAGFVGLDGLVVTDFISKTVYELDPATGIVRGSWPISTATLELPIGAAVINGELYVAIGFGSRYEVFTRAGTFLRSVTLSYEISALAGNG
ncbi:MAG: hypothetical protein QNJ98_03720 [Planctomycetota bacterium]|nr:hypothetical protein [Planctomycetota bacterium]